MCLVGVAAHAKPISTELFGNLYERTLAQVQDAPPAGAAASTPAAPAVTPPPAAPFPAGGATPPGGQAQPSGAAAQPVITQVPVDDYQRRVKELDDRLNDLLSIPEIPAAFALGLSPETVAHPGTIRDAVAAVTAHFGSDGSLKPGLAIEGAPFRPLFVEYDVDKWMKNATWPMQLLDSIRVSLATAADPTAPGGTMVPTLASAGLRMSLIDQRDYRHSLVFVKSVRDALTACFPEGPTVKPGDGGKNFSNVPVQGVCNTNLSKTLDDLAKTLTTGHRLELAAALTIAQTQPASNVDWRSTRLWLAYDWGFGGGTLGAAVDGQFRDDLNGRRVTDLTGGVRASLNRETVSWSIGALYGRIGQTADQSDNVIRYGTALSVKVPSYGVAGAGIQANHDFDSHADGAILFVSLSGANGETLFSRAYAAGAPVP